MELERRAVIELALKEFGGNPPQLAILLACAEKPCSAKDLAPSKADIGGIAYHFRVLADRQLIRFTRSEQRRGATAKFYVTTAKGKKLLAQLGVTVDGNTSEGDHQ